MKKINYPFLNRSMYALLLLLMALLPAGCDSFLDASPDKKLAVPDTLRDAQALLDNYGTMNQNNPSASGETSADNYYIPTPAFLAMSNEGERRKYTWEKDNLFRIGYRPNHWYNCFQTVYYANTVLDALQKIVRTPLNSLEWDNVKGQALYYRGEAMLAAAFLWAPAYDPATASTDLGLPLPSTNFNEKLIRRSVEQTYQDIIGDLEMAVAHLPATVPHVMRPSRAAAYALLARAYLSMRLYPEAGAYADSSLALQDRLLDYNTLSASPTYPIPAYNMEVLHHSSAGSPQSLTLNNARVDTLLFRQYEETDLRKKLFFRRNADGSYSFRGSYTGGSSHFAGTATNEMYLVQAESRARQGDADGAMRSLNHLLRHRWQAGTYVEKSATMPAEALQLVLQERRKELLMRGLRWMDIKRLNREGANITLTRNIEGKTYVLPPNDLRYALPLPEDVIALSGMQQNPR